MKKIFTGFIIFIMVLIINADLSINYYDVISSHTRGIISQDEIIKVNLSKEVSNIGKGIYLKNDLLKITPSISGKIEFLNNKYFIFKPKKWFDSNKTYNIELDLKVLYPKLNFTKEKYIFNVNTPLREVYNMSWDVESVESIMENAFLNKPVMLQIKGEISFNTSIPEEIFKHSVSLYDQTYKRNIPVNVKNISGNTVYFYSNPIQRTNKAINLKFFINRDKAGLNYNYNRYINIPAQKEMKVINVKSVTKSRESFIEIMFSEPISKDFKEDGYVRIKDYNRKSRSKIINNSILIFSDFEPGTSLNFVVKDGVLSKYGLKSTKTSEHSVKIEDIAPSISFDKDGIILPSTNKGSISFNSINVKKVDIVVKKIFDNNASFFMQDNSINSKNSSNYYYGLSKTGEQIYKDTLFIDDIKNKFIRTQIDMSELLKENTDGFFVVELKYDDYREKYTLHKNNYYSNISKIIIVSDIGIMCKKTDSNYRVYLSDLNTDKPVYRAKVRLYSYNNQLLDVSYSDSNGVCNITDKEGKGFYLTASKDSSISYLKFSDNSIDISSFDISGQELSSNLDSFIYTERDVYRPGDIVNINAIIRNSENSFSKDHPINIVVKDPKRKIVYQKVNKKGKDGFYTFEMQTQKSWLTGEYRISIEAAQKKWYKNIKIEEIVPEKIRVSIQSLKEELEKNDENLDFWVNSEYLYGKKSEGLKCIADIRYIDKNVYFNKYRDYIFSSEVKTNNVNRNYNQEKIINNEGKAYFDFKIPYFSKVSSGLSAQINVRVIQSDGRAVIRNKNINIHRYSDYIGIKNIYEDYVKSGNKIDFSVVNVNKDGKPLSGNKLFYKIYRNNRWWWWDYSSRNDFRKHYKSSTSTEIVKEGFVYSSNIPVNISFIPEDWGEYLIEVSGDSPEKHRSSVYFGAYTWGDQVSKDTGILQIGDLKDKYSIGETVKIPVRTTGKGRIILTIEKGGDILYERFYKVDKKNMEIKFNATEKMFPNSYAFITLIQPHEKRKNDLPLRLYALKNIIIDDNSRKLTYSIDCPDKVKPGESFKINIKTAQKESSQLTLSIVDEGLLGITSYKTADPYKYFYSRKKLSVNTYDNFNDVIALDWGDSKRRISIGGSDTSIQDEIGKRIDPMLKNNTPPVQIFKGILETDKNGNLSTEVTIPDYIGSLRVMVTGTKNKMYGNAQKSIHVRDDLIMLLSGPRKLSPGDLFKLPVTLFSYADKELKGKLSIDVSDNLEIIDFTENVSLKKDKDITIYVVLKVKNEIGECSISVNADFGSLKKKNKIIIPIISGMPYIGYERNKVVKPQEEIIFEIDKASVNNSQKIKFFINKRALPGFTERMEYLIHYPYGCLEQTVSSVFPQLYMNDIYNLSVEQKDRITKNIDSAIEKIRRFQLPDGSLSYWPGGDRKDLWSTTYAGQFLIECEKKGYYVPSDVINRWKEFQKSQCVNPEGDLYDRLYRVYVLSTMGIYEYGEMNLLKQNYFNKMSTEQKILLSASYYLSGNEKIGKDLMHKSLQVVNIDKRYYKYGGYIRNKAIVLDAMLNIEKNEKVYSFYEDMIGVLESKKWYSTHTLAYVLKAVSHFILLSQNDDTINAQIKINSKNINVDTQMDYTLDISEYAGSILKLKNNSKSEIYTGISWKGIPQRKDVKPFQSELTFDMFFIDKNGQEINIEETEQGEIFYIIYGIFNNSDKDLENVALTQIMSSGWEIENSRLNKIDIPRDFNISSYTHNEIRDDRIMWFFDIPSHEQRFYFVKINSVTKGEFYLPPATLEAMYDNDYSAMKNGRVVKVK